MNSETTPDLYQVKIGSCVSCEGWIIAACFPRCESNKQAVKDFAAIAKEGGKIEILYLPEWNIQADQRQMCPGHPKPRKTKNAH